MTKHDFKLHTLETAPEASADVQAFLSQGYSRSQLLDVMVGVSMKTLSNYVNHRADPPLE